MIKITALTDNLSEKSGIVAEHGLALHIKTESHSMLFDFGASEAFYKNANALNICLKEVDTAILSHGHYDHGGGLKTFLEINNTARVYINKNAFGDYYSDRKTGLTYIGLDKSLANNTQIVFCEGYTKVDDSLELFSDVKIVDERFSGNIKLKEKTDAGFIQDEFIHEQNLIVTSDGKTALIAGCAHNGITNIIKRFIEIKGFTPDCVISGFHLASPKDGTNEDINVIRDLGIRLKVFDCRYYTGHCTGAIPYRELKKILGDKIEYLFAGNTIIIQEDLQMKTSTEREAIAMDYFKQGYNCSQAVVAAFADVINVDFETAVKLSSSFGGGMGRLREVCGAMTGAFIVAGLLYGYENPTDKGAKTSHYERIQELAEKFKAENGSIVCRELLSLGTGADSPVPEDRTKEYYKKRPCVQLVGISARILNDYILENGI